MADQILQSSTNPHFFQPLLPGFDSYLNIPVTFFSKYVQGRNEHKTAKLRSNASDTTWEVKIDGRRLTRGWKEFVTAHDLRIGDVIVFRHEGDFVFHVTALGPSCCEIDYTSAHNIDDDNDNENIEIKPMKKKSVKKNQRKEEEDSSSYHSCFVINVLDSSLRGDKVYIPISFVKSNGLSKRHCKVVLLNEKGRSWELSLSHDKSGRKTYLKHGWRSFCNANGMKRGRYTFKLVRIYSGTPVIRLCQADAESSSSRSCFVGSLTRTSLIRDELYLPRGFVNSNGLKEGCCEMVLKNEYGGTWNLVLRHNKSNDNTFISRGWRSFCHENGLKPRDCFRLKLVKTGEKPVLCLCHAETNRDTRLAECSEDTDVSSLSANSSSGEESSETEDSEADSIEDISVKEESEEESMEKRKYCSRPRASSLPSQNRFATLSVTPYSVTSNKLRLPLRFTRVNGINKAGKIALLGQNGVYWMVSLVYDNKWGRMRLGSDWKGFCQVHGVKLGESFMLELIREKDGSPVLKFCTKSNSV